MTKNPDDSNINFFINKKRKAKFASLCKLRGVAMTDILKADVESHIAEWEAEKQPPKSIPAPSIPIPEKPVPKISVPINPGPEPTEKTKSKVCKICKKRLAVSGKDTCQDCQ